MINPLPPHSTRALRALADCGPLARSEIVTATGMSNERVHDALRSLKYRNLAGSQRTQAKQNQRRRV
jgi:DNA-binding transcriptional regulator GbsR (MarR family)